MLVSEYLDAAGIKMYGLLYEGQMGLFLYKRMTPAAAASASLSTTREGENEK